jgi:hypothetical protein
MSSKKFLGSLKPIKCSNYTFSISLSIIFTDDAYLSIFLAF